MFNTIESITDGALLLELLNGRRVAALSEARLERLLDLAGRHGLTALINEALAAQGMASDAWRDVSADLELNSRVQLKAAAELSQALDAANVSAVVAKGVALALSVYANPGLRPFIDIDVLIAPETLKRADGVLRGLGYALDRKSVRNPIECSYTREKLPGFPVSIDLHWSYTGGDGLQAPARIPIGEILERARVLSGVRMPADEDNILLAAGNMPRKAAQPFMLVVDFAKLARLAVDWNLVRERAVRWHVRTGLWIGFELARAHLNAPVDAAFLKSIEPPRLRRNWLLNALRGELLWDSEKHTRAKYSIAFKLMCLDSNLDELRALCALPRGVLRKLKLSRTLAEEILTR